MSNIVEEDDKSSYEDLEEIENENFDEISRKKDAILSDGGDDDDDDEKEEEQEEQEEKEEINGEEEDEKEEIDEEEQHNISDTIQNINPELLKKCNLD